MSAPPPAIAAIIPKVGATLELRVAGFAASLRCCHRAGLRFGCQWIGRKFGYQNFKGELLAWRFDACCPYGFSRGRCGDAISAWVHRDGLPELALRNRYAVALNPKADWGCALQGNANAGYALLHLTNLLHACIGLRLVTGCFCQVRRGAKVAEGRSILAKAFVAFAETVDGDNVGRSVVAAFKELAGLGDFATLSCQFGLLEVRVKRFRLPAKGRTGNQGCQQGGSQRTELHLFQKPVLGKVAGLVGGFAILLMGPDR
jgi:hypothetical protein